MGLVFYVEESSERQCKLGAIRNGCLQQIRGATVVGAAVSAPKRCATDCIASGYPNEDSESCRHAQELVACLLAQYGLSDLEVGAGRLTAHSGFADPTWCCLGWFGHSALPTSRRSSSHRRHPHVRHHLDSISVDLFGQSTPFALLGPFGRGTFDCLEEAPTPSPHMEAQCVYLVRPTLGLVTDGQRGMDKEEVHVAVDVAVFPCR